MLSKWNEIQLISIGWCDKPVNNLSVINLLKVWVWYIKYRLQRGFSNVYPSLSEERLLICKYQYLMILSRLRSFFEMSILQGVCCVNKFIFQFIFQLFFTPFCTSTCSRVLRFLNANVHEFAFINVSLTIIIIQL